MADITTGTPLSDASGQNVEVAALAKQALACEVWQQPLGNDLPGQGERRLELRSRREFFSGLVDIFNQAGDPQHPDRPLTLQQQQDLHNNLAQYFSQNAESINRIFFGGVGSPQEMNALLRTIQNGAPDILRQRPGENLGQQLAQFMENATASIHSRHVRDNVTARIDMRVACNPTPADGASIISQDLRDLSDADLSTLFGNGQTIDAQRLSHFRWALQRRDNLEQLAGIFQRGGDVATNVLNWAQGIMDRIPHAGVLNLLNNIRDQIRPDRQRQNQPVRLPNEHDMQLLDACNSISLGQGTPENVSELLGALTNPLRYGLDPNTMHANPADTRAFFEYALQAIANQEGGHWQHLRQVIRNNLQRLGHN